MVISTSARIVLSVMCMINTCKTLIIRNMLRRKEHVVVTNGFDYTRINRIRQPIMSKPSAGSSNVVLDHYLKIPRFIIGTIITYTRSLCLVSGIMLGYIS